MTVGDDVDKKVPAKSICVAFSVIIESPNKPAGPSDHLIILLVVPVPVPVEVTKSARFFSVNDFVGLPLTLISEMIIRSLASKSLDEFI